MRLKKRPFLPFAFLARLGLFFVLSVAVFLFRYWYSIRYDHVVVSIYNSYQIFLIYPLLLLFACVFRERIRTLAHYPVGLFWAMTFYGVSLMLTLTPFSFFLPFHLGTILMYFTALYVIYFCLFLAVFGFAFAKIFVRELLLLANVSLFFLLCSYLIDVYWRSFAFVILRILEVVLPRVADEVTVNISDLSVTANGFRVIVGASCAGAYSLFLFALFFSLTLYFTGKTKKIDYGRSAVIFISGFFVLFALNIIRIALLVWIGANYSKQIAVSFFHEYTASVFFLIFLSFFLAKVSPFLQKDSTNVVSK